MIISVLLALQGYLGVYCSRVIETENHVQTYPCSGFRFSSPKQFGQSFLGGLRFKALWAEPYAGQRSEAPHL